MNIRVFIHRPILSTVISLIIALCGLVAAFNMPVDEYPNVTPPSISINANYPGASAEDVEKTVAAQLEAKLNGAGNLLYMNSHSSSTGSVSIQLTFEIGTNLNFAVNEVLNRVHAAMPLLPAIVQAMGVKVRKNSPDMLMGITFYNNGKGGFDRKFLSNYLQRTLYNDLSLVLGVGQITLHGDTYAMRVWLDVNKMNSLNFSPNDIASAIREQSKEYVVGRSNSAPTESALLTFNLSGNEMFKNPKQFESIVLRANGTQIVRLRDVARVELGSLSYNVSPRSTFYDNDNKLNDKLNDKPHDNLQNKEMVMMIIYLDSAANQLEVKHKVLNRLAEDAKNFPPGVGYHVVFDASQFVSASIDNVEQALQDAFILVGLVILLFLHNWKASIIALLTVPVSVLGAFMCLKLLGMSVNTLSLFALILAIGIVVDDAIVILENIERLRLHYPKLQLRQIVELALHEVFSAVVAIALVLSVVFLPVILLKGLSGVLYRQFAITIACTVIISAITALTLTPAVSMLFLKHPPKMGKFARRFDLILDNITQMYLKLASRIIDWGKYALITLVVVIIAVIGVFHLVPLSFIPNEDQGYFFASVNLPSSSSLSQTQKVAESIADKIAHKPGVHEVMQINGVDFFGGGVNAYASTIIVILDNWKDRPKKSQVVDEFVDYTNSLNKEYKNTTIRAFNLPPIRGLSSTGGVEFYLEDRAVGDLNLLDKVATDFDKRMMKHKEVKSAYHVLNTNVEQIMVKPDVDRAKFYGVSINTIYGNLQSIYSNYNVNFAYLMQGLIWVILQAEYRYRISTNNMDNVYVKNNSGQPVPLNSLVKTSYYKVPAMVERFNDYLATQEIIEPNKGYTSGDVMGLVVTEMGKMPIGYNYEWFGSSYMQNNAQQSSTLAFVFSLCMIYLVLSALYEMWRLPLVVLMGVPFALFGSGIMLLLRNQPNDLYFQISLITLLGLSAKNIILLIEFALKHLEQGYSAKESALYALQVRFRPIVMTSITFIMGALPLIFATGAGANAEHSVGTGIIGGMIGSVILGTLFVPSYFVLIMHNFKRQQHDV